MTTKLEQSSRMSQEALLIALARVDPEFFGYVVWGLRAAKHHRIWLKEAADPNNERLVIVAPPGHAKSTWLSMVLPTWLIGTNPNISILLASNTGAQAELFSNTCRLAVTTKAYTTVFPEVQPDYDLGWSQKEWFVKRSDLSNKDPTLAAYGVGGPIIGRRLDCAILDDVCDLENTSTQLQRDKVWNWFTQVLLTRMKPHGSRVIIIGTRWHEDDLIGRIIKLQAQLEDGRYRYKIINTPALGFWKDPERPLWPEYIPKEILDEKKRELGEIDFELIYNGNPMPNTGIYFRKDRIHYYDLNAVDISKMDPVYTVTVDPAVSETDKACRTAIVVCAQTKGGRGPVYVTHAVAGHWNPKEIVDNLFFICRGLHPLWVVGIETVVFQKMLAFYIREKSEERGIWLPVRELKADKDKHRRIMALQPHLESGRIRIGTHLKDLETELLGYDKYRYKDILDALAYQLQVLMPTQSDMPVEEPKKPKLPWPLRTDDEQKGEKSWISW